MKYKIIFLFALTLFLIVNVEAQINADDIAFYVTQGQNFTIKDTCTYNGFSCSSSFVCNLTIIKPDLTYLLEQSSMFKQGDYFNYNLNQDNSTDLGIYTKTIYCQNGTLGGQETEKYQVTTNGKAPPEGIVLVLFSVIFFAIVFSLLFIFLYSFGGLLSLNYDVRDVSLNVGVYFVLLLFQIFQKFYVGDPTMNSLSLTILEIIIYTNVYLPLLAFILTMTLGVYLRMKFPNYFARMPGYKPIYKPNTGGGSNYA